MKIVTFLMFILALSQPIYARDGVGPPDELFLPFGKSVAVGDSARYSVRMLEESLFDCDKVSDKRDQLISCRAPWGSRYYLLAQEISYGYMPYFTADYDELLLDVEDELLVGFDVMYIAR